MSKKMERRSQKVKEGIKKEIDEVFIKAKEKGCYYIHVSYLDDDKVIQHFNAHVDFNIGNLVNVGNNIDDFLRDKIPPMYCETLRLEQRSTRPT